MPRPASGLSLAAAEAHRRDDDWLGRAKKLSTSLSDPCPAARSISYREAPARTSVARRSNHWSRSGQVGSLASKRSKEFVRLAAGETVPVTDRDRVVAEIEPSRP